MSTLKFRVGMLENDIEYFDELLEVSPNSLAFEVGEL